MQSWSQALIYLFARGYRDLLSTNDDYHEMISILFSLRGLISLSGELLQLLRWQVFSVTAAVWGTVLYGGLIFTVESILNHPQGYSRCSQPLF